MNVCRHHKDDEIDSGNGDGDGGQNSKIVLKSILKSTAATTTTTNEEIMEIPTSITLEKFGHSISTIRQYFPELFHQQQQDSTCTNVDNLDQNSQNLNQQQQQQQHSNRMLENDEKISNQQSNRKKFRVKFLEQNPDDDGNDNNDDGDDDDDEHHTSAAKILMNKYPNSNDDDHFNHFCCFSSSWLLSLSNFLSKFFIQYCCCCSHCYYFQNNHNFNQQQQQEQSMVMLKNITELIENNNNNHYNHQNVDDYNLYCTKENSTLRYDGHLDVPPSNVLRTFCPDEWKYSFLTIYSMNNLGLAIAFAISEFICLYIKIYSLIIILIFACIPMQLCELRLMKFEKILGPGSQSQL